MKRDEVLGILEKFRDELREAYGVDSIALFGSIVRDEAGPNSDIDLLVEFNRPVGMFLFLELKEYLEKILGHRVDLVTRSGLKRQLRDRILREALDAS